MPSFQLCILQHEIHKIRPTSVFYKQTHSEKQDTVSQSNGSPCHEETVIETRLDKIDIAFILLDEGIVASGPLGQSPSSWKFWHFLTMKFYYFACKLAVLFGLLTSEGWGLRGKVDFLAGMENFSPAARMTEISEGEGPKLPLHTYTALHS